jgi:signal peptidase II
VRKRLALYLPVLLVALALDQLTKAWARGALVEGQPEAVLGTFWHWRLSFNTGMAFSLLDDSSAARVLLPVIAIVTCAVITWMAARSEHARRPELVGLALVASGALGNVIDRLLAGQVTDFVLWQAFGYSWPVFNIADVALVVGVILLAVPRVAVTVRAHEAPKPH